jgi:hypothetical protein
VLQRIQTDASGHVVLRCGVSAPVAWEPPSSMTWTARQARVSTRLGKRPGSRYGNVCDARTANGTSSAAQAGPGGLTDRV